MELLILLALLFFGGAIFQAFTSTVSATAKTVAGKGSFSENMDLAFKGMGPLEARLKDARLGDDDDSPEFKAIEVRGLFPVSHKTRVGSIASVFDATGEKYKPVISLFDAFQEPDNVVYQHRVELGQVGPDQGFGTWVQAAAVLPDALQPPVGGARKLAVAFRLVDLDDPPTIQAGFRDPDSGGVLWEQVLEFTHVFDEKGYEEAAEHRDESRAISIQIAMAVAMADGSLDDAEGKTFRSWILKSISPFGDEKRKSLKSLYNGAMREGHARARAGDLSLSSLTAKLNEIGERSIKYEAIELCFDVMAADGVADADELKVIRSVAEALDLDFDEIERIHDQKLISLDSSVAEQASIEDLLGIDPNWEVDQIKRYLRDAFLKWNNRINTVAEGDERDNAQRMLDLIAAARKKYD